jgi:FkbM family methyltransferase
MSCDYFLLTKPSTALAHDETHNQVLSFSGAKSYILPKTNLHYYADNGLFEKYLISWAAQFCHSEKVMLDIGAHSGTYTVSLANYCKHVYSFEPQRLTYYSLCGSVALSNLKNVTCYQFGLGSEDQVGKKTLNIVSHDGGGSTLHVNNLPVLQTEEIEIRTLDSFDMDNVGFIKIDVEENELQVLRSGMNTLIRSGYPPILFEMNAYNHELCDFLRGLGYAVMNVQNCANMYLATKE